MVALLPIGLLQAHAQEVVDPNCDLAQETPLATMVAKSSIVVEGIAGPRRGCWNASHTRLLTATTVTVYKVFKGQIQGNQVEFITPGGGVGNLMELIQDGSSPALGGAGLFFGVPTQQAPTGSTLPAAQVLDVYNVYEGYFTYRGDGSEAHSTAFSACRRYRNVPTTLYVPLQQAAGQLYRELAPFNLDTYNRYAALRHSPREALPPHVTAKTPAKRKAKTKAKLRTKANQ